MGSLELPCPLCCTETFSCHNSLKYHLLSISDNLICPSCGNRFERIFDLAMHLGNKCIDPTSDIDNIVMPICIKVETDSDSNTVTNSILARALTKDRQDQVDEANKNDENLVDEEDVYFCSTCNIHLTSIEDHIKKFHDGHEVYVEENKCDSTDDAENSIPIFITQDGSSIDKEQNLDEEFRQGGLVYTRKLVKIEKFWDKNATENDEKLNNDVKVTENDVEILEENDNTESDQTNVTIVQIYECSKCNLPFTSEELFGKHNCKDAITKNCEICGESFSSTKLLNVHMKTHKKNVIKEFNTYPPYLCEICNTEFPSYKSLRLHRRMHEPTKSKTIEPPASYGIEGEEVKDAPREKFICVICCKEYDKEYAEAHKKFHSEEKDYNCEVCNRKFFSQDNLDMHMHAHSGTKKFLCSYCKKGFLSNDKLEAHMSTKCHMRQYECQYCGRRFSRPHEKVKHERIHTGEKPHKCEICGKAFRVSYCLTLHMRTHSGTRPYKCDHCGKRFKAHSVYNHHLLTHSEDRKYKCPFCPKTFKTGVQLAGHKNSHTKPFTCTECNRPFASLYAVRSHMATHKRQNNLKYKCWLCGASYARSFALRDHIKEHHYDDINVKENPSGQLENMDYVINETIEGEESILPDGGENMLIDIADDQGVHDIVEVAITPALSDNN